MQPNPEILDRIPPRDADAERCVLGSVLLQPSRMEDVDHLQPGDFAVANYQAIFRLMLADHQAGRPIDLITILPRLNASGAPDGTTWAGVLADVMNVGSPANAGFYAKTVREKAELRNLISIGWELVRGSYAETSTEELINAVETQLMQIGVADKMHSEPKTAMQAALAFNTMVDQISEHQKALGLPTGMVRYDSYFGGLFAGELVILAARPGVGKSALGMQIAYHNAARGRPVLFSSLEMSATELTSRIVCGLAGVNSRRIRNAKIDCNDQRELAEASNTFSKAQLYIDDKPGMSVLDVRRAARRLKRRGLALVVVDYLQRLAPVDRRVQRHEQIGQMTDALKQLARELELPILVLCQLNRQSEQDDRPRLSHLRESGSIEQDADCVWLLSRKCSGAADVEEEHKQATLYVEKNRNGPTGCVQLTWSPELVRYECGWQEEAQARPNYEPAFEQFGR